MNRKQYLFFVALGLLLLSMLNYIPTPEFIWIWKLSILTKEFGHYFALLCVAIIISIFLRRRPTAVPYSFVLLIAALGFSKPLYQLAQMPEQWAQFSWKVLWLGRGDAVVPFESVNYGTTSNPFQTMDYYPAENPNGAWVLVVHGGGWDSGDSSQVPDLNSHLAKRGYAVFAMNYRLAPKSIWPAQKEDVLMAVDYIRSHSAKLNIKPEHWMILGRSAGAQIGAATAYSLPEEQKPKAVVMFYGPTEMTFAYEVGFEDDILASRGLVRNYMGGDPYHEQKKNYDDASPIFYLSKKTPPTLILHGQSDNLVWYKHSERLYKRLKLAEVPVKYIEFPWATHGFDFNLNGPGGQISTANIENYLSEFVLSPK